ncbi:MAG: metallophosphoesterase [Parabacteroides sp.]|nr:metallophosphoesterase [Parabacteroides sp.]
MKSVKLVFVIACFLFTGKSVWAQTNDAVIRFGLFADTQYGDCDNGATRFYRNALQKLEKCVDCFNEKQVDFAVNLGDIVDRNPADLEPVLACLGRLKCPLYHTTGNHDYKGRGNNRELYDKLGMPAEYYSIKKGNWTLVFLNTNEVAAYSNVAGTEKEQELIAMTDKIKATDGIQGARWNGGVSKRQLAWLDKLLAENQQAGKSVAIFSHHPFYPRTEFTALNNLEILETIERYPCVKIILSGHHHAGAFAYYKTIPVVTVEGMIETENENSFGIVTLSPDKIEIERHGRMTSRIFEK